MQSFSSPPSGLAHSRKGGVVRVLNRGLAVSGHHLYRPLLCSSKRCIIAVQNQQRPLVAQSGRWRLSPIRGMGSYSPLISLGDLFVQRRNARRKFVASLNPSASAISSFPSLVVRRYFSAICIRSSSSKPRKEMPWSRS